VRKLREWSEGVSLGSNGGVGHNLGRMSDYVRIEVRSHLGVPPNAMSSH
jgi:hypothetical protein